jgi:hypothetical protein
MGTPLVKLVRTKSGKGRPLEEERMVKEKGKGKWNGKGGGKGIGKGKGKTYQRNLGDRKPAEDGNEKKERICHNWSRGNGYCKYGPSCNYRHDGPQGGKKRNADSATLLTSGGTKKSRKTPTLAGSAR